MTSTRTWLALVLLSSIALSSHADDRCEDREPFTIDLGEDQQIRMTLNLQVTVQAQLNPLPSFPEEVEYRWEFVGVPKESTVAQSGLDEAYREQLTFYPDLVGPYVLALHANYGCIKEYAEVEIEVLCGDMLLTTGDDQELTFLEGMVAEVRAQVLDKSLTAKLAARLEAPDNSALDVDSVDVVSYEDEAQGGLTEYTAKFVPDVAGKYIVTFHAANECDQEDERTVYVSFLCPGLEARAGDDQTIVYFYGVHVSLDASSSVTSPGVEAGWNLLEAPDDGQSIAIRPNESGLRATFEPKAPGIYQFRFTLTSGCGSSTDDVLVEVVCSNSPSVSIDVAAEGLVGDVIVLDGTETFDVEHDTLVYAWEVGEKPDDSDISDLDVIGGHTAYATVTPDAPGEYVFALSVSDGCTRVVEEQFVTVREPCNHLAVPQIRAGIDEEMYWKHNLVKVVSWDVEGDPLDHNVTVSWALTDKPDESKTTAIGVLEVVEGLDTTATATLRLDVVGDYGVELRYKSRCFDMSDAVDFTVICNDPPLAIATAPEEAETDLQVVLDGSNSFDSDENDGVAFSWSVVEVPSGSTVDTKSVTGGHTSLATYTPDVPGDYVIMLKVSDGCTTSTFTLTTRAFWRCRDGMMAHPVAVTDTFQNVTYHDGVEVPLSAKVEGTDEKGGEVARMWSFARLPESSVISEEMIEGPHGRFGESISFFPDTPGHYEVKFAAGNRCHNDSVTFTVNVHCNTAPEAKIVATDTSFARDLITLDGTQSLDVEGDLLSFRWYFDELPANSSLSKQHSMVDANTQVGSFYPDVAGIYIVQLRVADDCSHDVALHSVLVYPMCEGSMSVTPDAGPVQRLFWSAELRAVVSGSVTKADERGGPIALKWTVVSQPDGSEVTSESLFSSDTDTSSFHPDKPGTYGLQLEATNRCHRGSDLTKVVVVCDQPPAPVVDHHDTTLIDEPVKLDASATVDPDGDKETENLTFSWELSDGPKNEEGEIDARILGSNTNSAVFTPNTFGSFSVQLSVCDGCNTVSKMVQLLACDPKQSLRLRPMDDLNVTFSDALEVTVESGLVEGHIFDGGDVEVVWSFVSRPRVSQISGFLDDDARGRFKRTFHPDIAGEYIVKVDVWNSCHQVSEDVVVLVHCNTPPVAVASVPSVAVVGDEVYLDGTESHDKEDLAMWFHWHFQELPVNSDLGALDITGGNTALAQFYPDVAGVFEIQLIVTDGCTRSTDTVSIQVWDRCTDEMMVQPSNTDDDKAHVWYPGLEVTLHSEMINDDARAGEVTTTWQFVSKPEDSKLENRYIHHRFHLTSSFNPDRPGVYVVELVTSNRCNNGTARVSVNVTCNEAPEVKALLPRSVKLGHVVEANVDVTDVNLDELTYVWKLLSSPDESEIESRDLVGRFTNSIEFLADVGGDFEVGVTVSDGCSEVTSSADVFSCDSDRNIQLEQPEETRVVWAEDQMIDLSTRALNDDYDGGDFEVQWTLVDAPKDPVLITGHLHDENHSVDSANGDPNDKLKTSFHPEVAGTFVLRATAYNLCHNTSVDFFVHVVCNAKPVAFINAPSDVTVSDEIRLDGTNSSDADVADRLTYHWFLHDSPPESALGSLDVTGGNTALGSVIPDAVGDYTFQLMVTDGCTRATAIQRIHVWDECTSDMEIVTDVAPHHMEYSWSPDLTVTINSVVTNDDPRAGEPVLSWQFDHLPETSSLSSAPGGGLSVTSDLSDGVTFSPDVPGNFSLSFRAENRCATSVSSALVQVTCNVPPTPQVDAVSSVIVGSTVHLDASHTSDPDGDELELKWNFLGKPKESSLTSDDFGDISQKPSLAHFVPDAPGLYEIELSAFDGCSRVTTVISLETSVPCWERPKTREVTAKLNHDEGELLHPGIPVSISASTTPDDPQYGELTYSWSFISVPDNSIMDETLISGGLTPNATFRPDVMGAYSLLVVVSDGCTLFSGYISVISTCDRAPVAVINAPTDAVVGQLVELDASASFDPDGDADGPLTYSWKLVLTPSDSRLVHLSSRSDMVSHFYPDVPGIYRVVLQLSDGCSLSSKRAKIVVSGASILSQISQQFHQQTPEVKAVVVVSSVFSVGIVVVVALSVYRKRRRSQRRLNQDDERITILTL